MNKQDLDKTNHATITITYYFGPGDSPPYRLSKKYAVVNWQDETDLRRILDEIAPELNYMSGYGIQSIAVDADQLDFTVVYEQQMRPYGHDTIDQRILDFRALLRFNVGQKTGGGLVRLDIPRIHITTGAGNPVQQYDPNDNLFPIKAVYPGSAKKIRQAKSKYHLYFDRDNPIANAFFKHISKGGVLIPLIKPSRTWTQSDYVGPGTISWAELPKSQWSWTKWDKQEKEKEKKKRAEERERKKLEKAGIVFANSKQKIPANQVYIIRIIGDDRPNIYKIGVSNAPLKRLQSLNTANPFELELVHTFVAEPAEEAEALLHARFERTRMSGEWFRLTSTQIDELKCISKFKNGEFRQDDT